MIEQMFFVAVCLYTTFITLICFCKWTDFRGAWTEHIKETGSFTWDYRIKYLNLFCFIYWVVIFYNFFSGVN